MLDKSLRSWCWVIYSLFTLVFVVAELDWRTCWVHTACPECDFNLGLHHPYISNLSVTFADAGLVPLRRVHLSPWLPMAYRSSRAWTGATRLQYHGRFILGL